MISEIGECRARSVSGFADGAEQLSDPSSLEAKQSRRELGHTHWGAGSGMSCHIGIIPTPTLTYGNNYPPYYS